MRINLDYILLFCFMLFSIIPVIFNIDIMDFNFATNFVFFLLLFPFVFHNYDGDDFFLIFIPAILFVLSAVLTMSKIKYTILEFNKLLLPLFLILLISKQKRKKNFNVYFWFSMFFIVLQLLLVFLDFPKWNNDNYRFGGSFQNVNIISNIIMLSFVFIIEFLKTRGKLSTFIIIVCFIVFSLLILLTGTRSALLGVFYFLYIFWNRYSSKKKVLFFVFISISLLIFKYSDFLYEQLRFGADASTFTRLNIYTSMLNKIKDSYFLMPNGISAHRDFMEKYFWGYPVHNDFLQYIFDLGIVFYFYFYFIVSRIRIYSKSTPKVLLLLIFIMFFSTALHNELFSIYIWIPFYFILSLFYSNTINETKNEYNKNISTNISVQ